MTKEDQAIQELRVAVAALGGVTQAANKLEVDQTTVSKWFSRKRVPHKQARQIEKLLGRRKVKKERLCPQVYGC